jgi:hypothetical protein
VRLPLFGGEIMKIYTYIAAVLVTVFALACATTPHVAEEKAAKLKAGDIIPDFTLPIHTQSNNDAKKVSFNKDIKGKSKVIALVFSLSESSESKSLKNLLTDIAIMYGNDFKAYEINSANHKPLLEDEYGFNIKYTMSDPNYKIPRWFGFIHSPGLVIANGDGRILFIKAGYVPTTTKDSEKVLYVVKEAIKLKRKRGFFPLSPLYKSHLSGTAS